MREKRQKQTKNMQASLLKISGLACVFMALYLNTKWKNRFAELKRTKSVRSTYDIAAVSRHAIQRVLPHHKGIAVKSKQDRDWLFELRR